jgi:hypothetical protein
MAMRLNEGGAYMLAGHSRDACIHGVLADSDSADRESLNLRFGLHDYAPNSRPSRQSLDDTAKCDNLQSNQKDKIELIHNTPSISNTLNDSSIASLPVIAASQVLKYWKDTTTDEKTT